MVFLSIFLTAFAGAGEFWGLGAVPPAAMISAFYACTVILALSSPEGARCWTRPSCIAVACVGYAFMFIFLWVYVAYYGGVIVVYDGVLRLDSDIRVLVSAIICEAVLLGLLTWLWVLAVWGREAARHPVSVVRARRAMRCSDELVWLRKQENELTIRRMRESLRETLFYGVGA
ncbi:hypothetical protein D5R93_01740 [Actinomyces lilanjuaniae]|uniref:Uncharacterized protein n=2 Tax=Actinomyces lilanjuaniae TaxID=2321394 RepID=A0ABN5PL84_9ACTO|nr:hypothetical protein D5R93_01740 [Actinomyces lilanjuaniae]